MREEQTDFRVLGIVASVAIVAIFVMVASTPTQLQVSNSLTGAVAGELEQPRAQELYDLPAYSLLDYNNDGVLDEQDTAMLAEAIGTGECPTNKECDLTGDGLITEQDLALYNKMLYVPITRRHAQQPGTERPQPLLTGFVASQRAAKTNLGNVAYPSTATRLG